MSGHGACGSKPADPDTFSHRCSPVPFQSLLQLDFEGLDGGDGMEEEGGGDDEDDFEAQMRALEEGL